MFTPDHITGQNAGQASCPPSPHAPQRPGLTWPCLCLRCDWRGTKEPWSSGVLLSWSCCGAGGDVNKGGEGESFRQPLIYSQEGGKPESRKHYSIVFWNWLNMCKITVLMINIVINIGRTWMQLLQRLLLLSSSSSFNFFFFLIIIKAAQITFFFITSLKFVIPCPSRLPYGKSNGS